MNSRILFVVIPALVLASCGSAEQPDGQPAETVAAAPAEGTEAAAAPAPAASATAGGKPDVAFMVGKWATEGDCDVLGIDFKADGTMDGPFEKWELADGVLTMVGNPRKMHLTIVDDKTLESRPDGMGDPDKLVRCS